MWWATVNIARHGLLNVGGILQTQQENDVDNYAVAAIQKIKEFEQTEVQKIFGINYMSF